MTPAMPWRVVNLAEDGLTLQVTRPMSAAALAQALLGSKAATKRVFAQGQLARAEVRLLPSQQLAEGEVVRLAFAHEAVGTARAVDPQAEAPTIVYRDPLLLAADKPAGLLVHSDGTEADTLTARVQEYLTCEGSSAQAQAVQRLDVETTGLVLFSLTREFQPVLDAQVAGHDMRKRYLAAIEGEIAGARNGWLELTEPIGRDRHDARRMRVARTGKSSLTRVRTIATGQGRSLLLVELGSGRRHQIRVHLAHAGHPIMGDALYGGAHHGEGLMLHALEERLTHPASGETLVLATTVPDRFVHVFAQLPRDAAAITSRFV